MSQSDVKLTETFPSTGNHAWLAYDAYVFDIDGTLLNSRDLVHYKAFNGTLRDIYGCDLTIDHVPVHGNTDIGILRATARAAGVADETFAQRLPEALARMIERVSATAHDFRPELCPAITALLARLKDAGKLLGVATGNLESIGWRKLQAAGLRDYFDFGSFSDQRELRQEIFAHAVGQARARLGERARVCFVGDTPSDITAAQQNGAPVIAVATGIYPIEQLQALSPDFCVTCCDELLS